MWKDNNVFAVPGLDPQSSRASGNKALGAFLSLCADVPTVRRD